MKPVTNYIEYCEHMALWEKHLCFAEKWIRFPLIILFPVWLVIFVFWWMPKSNKLSRERKKYISQGYQSKLPEL